MPRRSVVLVLAACAALAGCDSAEPLSATEYFGLVEDELSRLDQATKDLTDRYASELEDDIDALIAETDLEDDAAADALLGSIFTVTQANTQAILTAHTSQLDVFVLRVSALLPPELITSLHDELLAAMDGWAASGEPTLRRLAAATEFADIVTVLTDSPYAEAQARVDAACSSLVANAVAVEIELTCPGTRSPALAVRP